MTPPIRIGHVDPDESGVGERRRVEVAHEAVEALDLQDAREVAHRAVHDDALAGLREDRRAEVVADEGALVDLPVEVDDEHVAGLKVSMTHEF